MFVCFVLGLGILIAVGDYGNKVAVIPIRGLITTQDAEMFFDGTSSKEIIEYIEIADEDTSIKAIVFEINSGGGSAVASDEIGSAIKKTNKTTVAWIREAGASGGYWVASCTDHIIANRMSITGSIGVISSYIEFPGLLEKHNITYTRLVGGEYKDAGIPMRETTQEELDLMQEKVDVIHDIFIREVAVNRDLSEEYVREVATGMFFIGTEALELGLVDELGGKDEVEVYLSKELEIEEVNFVEYKRKKSVFESFGQVLSQIKINTDFLGLSGVRI